jgi:hypothetical protein
MRRLLILIFFTYHSSAHSFNSVTCDNARHKSGFQGVMTFVMGTVFQVGDCALIDAAKFEFGTYYENKKDVIIRETKLGYPAEGLLEFTRALECKKNIYNAEIARFLISSKDEIFGADYAKSGRQVMLGAKRMIRENSEIAGYCSSDKDSPAFLGATCPPDENLCQVTLQASCFGYIGHYALKPTRKPMLLTSNDSRPFEIATNELGYASFEVPKGSEQKFKLMIEGHEISAESAKKQAYQVILPSSVCQ